MKPIMQLNPSSLAYKILVTFFSGKGRLGRLNYVLYYLFGSLIYLIFILASYSVFPPIQVFFYICAILTACSLSIKRLHDLNMSGFYLLIILIPLANIFLILKMLFYPAKNENNKYGEPKENLEFIKPGTNFGKWINKERSRVYLVVVLIILSEILSHYLEIDNKLIDKSNELLAALNKGKENTAQEFEKLAGDASYDENKMEMYKNAAYVFSSENNPEKAKENFNNALKLARENSFDYYLITGEIALLENKARVALYNYEKAYSIRPEDFQINNSLGLFYIGIDEVSYQFADYEKALKYFQKSYEKSPQNIVKENIAITYFFLEDFDKALTLFFEAQKESDANYLDYWIGLCYLGKDDIPNAKIYLKKAQSNGVSMEQEIVDFINKE